MHYLLVFDPFFPSQTFCFCLQPKLFYISYFLSQVFWFCFSFLATGLGGETSNIKCIIIWFRNIRENEE